MTPGWYIAAGFWGLLACVVLYGLSHDLRRWLEERRWKRDECRAERDLAVARERGGYRPKPTLTEHIDRQPPARVYPESEEGLEFRRQALLGSRERFLFAEWLASWPVLDRPPKRKRRVA